MSQPMGIFTAHFAAHFAVAKWEGEATKWHSCAKEVFCRGFRSCEMRLWLRNEALGALDGFAVVKWGFGL